jgi:Holliday junction resolvase
MKNSRRKGAVGEREFASLLRDHKLDARRGQQFSGGTDSPDVVSSLTGVHFEVKRVQAGNPYDWLAQAQRDAGKKVPIVAHRRNHKDWIAIVPMDELLKLLIMREATLL